MGLDWDNGGLAKGLRCYRAGEFFAAHEHWEAIWLASHDPERIFLQALIQVAAAFHHHSRDNNRGTRLLLGAALGRLEPFPDCFGGISVSLLRDDIRQCLRAMEIDLNCKVLPPNIRLER